MNVSGIDVEGKRYFDLVRVSRRDSSTNRIMGFVSKVSKSEKLSTNMSKIDALYWPINDEELKVNNTVETKPVLQNE